MQFIRLTKKELLGLKENRDEAIAHFILQIQTGEFPPWAVTVRLQKAFCADHKKQEEFLISSNRNFDSWHLDSEEIKEAWKVIH